MAIMNDFLAQLADAEKKAEQLRTQFDETVGKQAQASFEQIKEILDTYMRFLTDTQRNTILSMLRMKGSVAAPQSAAKSNAGKTFTVQPKYQLPTGETWAGRGQARTRPLLHGLDQQKGALGTRPTRTSAIPPIPSRARLRKLQPSQAPRKPPRV